MRHAGDRLEERVTPGPAVGVVAVTLLGGFSVSVDGVAIDASRWKHRHPRLLLQMLCLAPGHQVSRDEAAEALWPQAGVQASSNRLYHTLHALRGIFGEEGVSDVRKLIQLQGGTLRLDAGVPLDLDVERFRQAVHDARARNSSDAAMAFLEAARALHRDALVLSPGAEDWFAAHRHALLRDQVWVLEQLSQRYQAAGRTDDVVQAVQALARLEPANEAAHRRLIELYDAQGRPDLAAQQYSVCCRSLRRERGAPPSAATQALAQRIAGSKARSAASDAPVDEPPARVRFVAPPRASPLLGRSADLDVLQRWLGEGGSRLITITAAGGVGKTRLAAALAERVQDRFRDGVYFLPLSTLTQPSQLAERVFRALRPSSSQHSADQSLLPLLQARDVLLVLDCFEHLVGAAPQLSKWLEAAPQLYIVVTSQCALKLRSERVYELPTLLKRSPSAAAALFVLTARSAGFVLDSTASRPLIERVCERVDGNALAIELAAAQLGRVGLDELPHVLAGAPLGLLVSTVPDDERRHTSLEATIAWSCSLLTAAQTTALTMVSVFAGDFGLEDAQAVLTDLFDKAAVQALLRCLVDRHLLSPSVDAVPRDQRRFALLDSVRDFVRRHAEADSRWGDVQRRHADHFDQVAERAYAAFEKGLLAQCRSIYNAAAADIGQSMGWRQKYAAAEDHLRGCWHLSIVQIGEGAEREAIGYLQHAVGVSVRSRREKDNKSWCCLQLARAYNIKGNLKGSMQAIRAARALAQGGSDTVLKDRLDFRLAVLLLAQLQFTAVQRCVDRSLARLPRSGSEDLRATYHLLSAFCLDMQGRYEQAVSAAERAVECAYEACHVPYTAMSLQALAAIYRRWGRLDQARASLHERVALVRSGDSVFERYDLAVDQGVLAFERGQLAAASGCFEHAVRYARSHLPQLVTAAELRLACVAIECGRDADAELVLSAPEHAFAWRVDHANEYVRIRAYRLRLKAERGDWPAVQATLKRLQQLQHRTGNPLWASWIAESAALLAHRLGRVELARSALQLSKRLQADRGIHATPRQVASWARVDARLQQAPPCAAPQDASVVVVALERALPDLRRCVDAPARRAEPAAPTQAPARSAVAA
jgi:DNA-binding SARP family transcriptional activator/predicted ATPase